MITLNNRKYSIIYLNQIKTTKKNIKKNHLSFICLKLQNLIISNKFYDPRFLFYIQIQILLLRIRPLIFLFQDRRNKF